MRIGGGREAFEAALTENDVQWRANVASTGRMNGYSFRDTGHVDAAGKPVGLKASDLDREAVLGRLPKDLVLRPVQVRVPPGRAQEVP
ncbi:hypothetical protein SAMN05421595_0363 [Austwickia chelonae]|uniref:Uncharacterized protein n=1 Tax=Austwickia chelonae NBRC 105200 TaxID=1184607 RepID=K6V6J0_9MICO|nr:hypothetical protein [Austwickia chelonae]GAB77853.1 hypothetical protein AUCHE_08_00950 [Austwickia chelonae NBRC 105200]SEV90822.1 hypothetical protein SAMN05421595_0363 [Austwickia chelonae]